MKHSFLFLLSFFPSFLMGGQDPITLTTITPDIHENLASIDDVMSSFEGSVAFDEETGTYTYTINDQEIILNLNCGYSLINGEKEALFLERNDETALMTIKWVTPKLIDDEVFVPVQYIERIFNATYSEEGFTLNGDASNTMTVFEDKEDSGDSAIGKRLTVEETEGEKEVSQTTNKKPSTSKPTPSITQKPEVSKPTQKPSTSKPNQNTTQKPSTSTPVKPQEPTDSPQPPVGDKPEEIVPPTPEPEPTPKPEPPVEDQPSDVTPPTPEGPSPLPPSDSETGDNSNSPESEPF